MLEEIKNIFSAGVVLPHFLQSFQNERSTDFGYILEGMIYFDGLIKNSDDLNSVEKYQYII